MNEQKRRIRKLIGEHPRYGLLLTGSLLYFLYKGVSYALINSFIPLLAILGILALWFYAFSSSDLAARRVARLWSFLLILWSAVRLLLAALNQFIKPIPEGHVNAQMGLAGTLLSLVILFNGIFLWYYRKRVFG